jgi:phosphopantothenoylcysteine decarboxylase/phosphopantothenate--cysteine ligase
VMLITAAELIVPTPGVDVVSVETAGEMHEAVRAALPGARILIMAAAVADWRPSATVSHKLKKRAGTWNLELVPTVDILKELRDDDARRGVFVVGFAAETEDVVANAETKLREKGLDLMIVNDVSRADIGMGSDDNEVAVIDGSGVVEVIPRSPKPVVANALLRMIRTRLR